MTISVEPNTYCQSVNHRPRYAEFKVWMEDGEKNVCKECFKFHLKRLEVADYKRIRRTR